MDMSNRPTPAVLHIFYSLIGIEFLIGAGIVIVVMGLYRRYKHHDCRSTGPDLLSRRIVRWGFGGLWILDGLLQAQPAMSSEFVPHFLDPLLHGQPMWYANILIQGIVIWAGHPLFWDSIAVWLQIGLGVLILFGRDSRAGRLGLWLSLLWSAVIWVMGEGLGGLLVPGNATWLSGTPGSAVFYGLAAVLLLLPQDTWQTGRVSRWGARGMAILWWGLTLLQAWPDNGFWTGSGLSSSVLNMAQMAQPPMFSAPLYFVAHIFSRFPVSANAILVGMMLIMGIGWWMQYRWTVPLTLTWLVLTWWLGQDFGVFGGLGTDPNSGLPVILLVIALRASQATQTAISRPQKTPGDGRMRQKLYSVSGVVLILIFSVGWGLHLTHAARQRTLIQRALRDGGLTPTGNRIAPNFHLVNQSGQAVTLRQFRGKVVVLTFLDPVCYDTCPVIASEMAAADTLLGANKNRVEFVAICANPVIHSPAALKAFDREHGLTTLSNWQYLTSSSVKNLKKVWASYYILVHAPSTGMVEHTNAIYWISPQGREVWLSGDSANPSLHQSYAELIATYAKRLLHGAGVS